MDNVLIFDGNNIVHRAYHVVSHNNQEWKIKDVIKIVVSMLYKQVDQTDDLRYVIFCWDRKTAGFEGYSLNRDIHENYKSGRNKDKNNDVYFICEKLIPIFKKIGIINILSTHYEADDSIGALVDNAVIDLSDCRKVIFTTDNDLYQLLSIENNIEIYNWNKKCLVKQLEKFRNAEEYIFYKCVVGDKSDNIDGLYNFGEKKFRRLLNNEIELTKEQLAEVQMFDTIIRLNKHTQNEQYRKTIESQCSVFNNSESSNVLANITQLKEKLE